MKRQLSKLIGKGLCLSVSGKSLILGPVASHVIPFLSSHSLAARFKMRCNISNSWLIVFFFTLSFFRESIYICNVPIWALSKGKSPIKLSITDYFRKNYPFTLRHPVLTTLLGDENAMNDALKH